MNYRIHYSCCTHIGKRRRMNQDNYYCDGRYIHDAEILADTHYQKSNPIHGCLEPDQPQMFAVFDGMGGEECGEKASLIAAEFASKYRFGPYPVEDLLHYCKDANDVICSYARENNISSMGTTAAILVFAENEISLCNIGDSKVFRFDGDKLEQISIDHYAAVSYGIKHPLSQYLGIPSSEMAIEPHLARGYYHDGDIYLLCSDGLTDMVSTEKIRMILKETEFSKAPDRLMDEALNNGGRDNITIILCMIERKNRSFFCRFLR